jgi:ankyrin repeat protein
VFKTVANPLGHLCAQATKEPDDMTSTRASTEQCEQDEQLWWAARKGDVARALELLRAGARPTWRMDHSEEHALEYKNRRMTSQPLHAAALFQAKSSREEGPRRAEEIVRMLLEARADVTAQAVSELGDQSRKVQALHMAAGAGNVGVIRLLLEHGADPDAAANLEIRKEGMDPVRHMHYLPLHDAAWLNKTAALKCLLEHKAKLTATNNGKLNVLHMAAQQGHVNIVDFLVSRVAEPVDGCDETPLVLPQQMIELTQQKNNAGATPLDLAVEHCMFPPSRLHLFTQHTDKITRARDFVKVAGQCPSAASALLRSDGEADWEGLDPSDRSFPAIDEEWRKSLQHGAEKGEIDAEILADLVKKAPQAAMDLLDALTTCPVVVNREHHPLPVRVNIPFQRSDPCQLAASYEYDHRWECDPKELGNGYHGGKKWHLDLAPPCPKDGIEVNIKVLKLKGVASLEVLCNLSSTQDLRLFTKLAVHAMMRFIWSSFKLLFVVDLVHEAVAVAVLIFWTRDIVVESDIVRRLLWSIVASQGLSECLMLITTAWRCNRVLDRSGFMQWAWLMKHRMVVGAFTVVLAAISQEEYWPPASTGVSAVLAAASLLHWVHMLFELRGFQWTGQRLLPIMKSIEPLGGMLVVLLFLLLGFVQAFWAMDRERADEVILWEVVIFLFAGESMVDKNEDVGQTERGITVFLSMLGLLVFFGCTLNIFIAVLGDLYDQEHERAVCTFLKERAKICFTLRMRPEWRCRRLSERMPRLVVPFLLVAAYGLLLYLSSALSFAAWVPAMWSAVCFLFAQVWLEGEILSQWDEKYLWFCVDRKVDESMFMLEEARSVRSHGRIGRMKRHMVDQCKTISTECQTAVGELRSEVGVLSTSVEQTLAELRELRQELQQQPPQRGRRSVDSAAREEAAADDVVPERAMSEPGASPGAGRKQEAGKTGFPARRIRKKKPGRQGVDLE